MADAHAKPHHDYHLVNPSPWPIIGSIFAFITAIGLIMWMKDLTIGGLKVGPYFLGAGIIGVLYTIASWWRDGVYDFHHYHSTAHEVLGCYAGRATLQLGGPDGPTVTIARGDVVVLPAGTPHKRIEATRDFRVVGAYERGRDYDMLLGDPAVRLGAESRIDGVPSPQCDPIYGESGPLVQAWRTRTLTP